jgi:hypothetical protein
MSPSSIESQAQRPHSKTSLAARHRRRSTLGRGGVMMGTRIWKLAATRPGSISPMANEGGSSHTIAFPLGNRVDRAWAWRPNAQQS